MATEKSKHKQETSKSLTSKNSETRLQNGQRGQHRGQELGGGDDRGARTGTTKTVPNDSDGSRTGSRDNDDGRQPGDKGREGEGEPPAA